MRILILGGNGMLGHQLLESYQERHVVKVTLRGDLTEYAQYGLFREENTFSRIDACSQKAVIGVLDSFHPEVVINAIGVIKQSDGAKSTIPSIEINALLPHRLAELCRERGVRVIQCSTDCVFSGRKGDYGEDDTPDPMDLYGRTKLLGELHDTHCLTMRTSIIGLELGRKKSLIEWFLAQRGEVHGYRRAIYTGLTTMEFARTLEYILLNWPELSGVWHIASAPINKYEMLNRLVEILELKDVHVVPEDSFVCDRALDGSRFRTETGYVVPEWDSMLIKLAEQIRNKYKTRLRK